MITATVPVTMYNTPELVRMARRRAGSAQPRVMQEDLADTDLHLVLQKLGFAQPHSGGHQLPGGLAEL